jgi:hypothetical protein
LYDPVKEKSVSLSRKVIPANGSGALVLFVLETVVVVVDRHIEGWPDELIQTTMEFCYEELPETELVIDVRVLCGFSVSGSYIRFCSSTTNQDSFPVDN